MESSSRSRRRAGYGLLAPLSSWVCLAWGGAATLGADDALAQDVEMLARHYGTPLPAAYRNALAQDPEAFSFGTRAFGGHRAESDRRLEPLLDGASNGVEGTYRFPLLPILYSDSPATPLYAAEELQREYFDGPNTRGATIRDYYAEISGGRVDLLGQTFPWARSALDQETVAGGASGLGAGKVGQFILDGLEGLDSLGVDWGQFDNDGADGIPNSGDDDGFVDVLAVMHGTRGAECDADENSTRIWSHRWTLSAAAGRSFLTSTPSASSANSSATIRVDNYTIQPSVDCAGVSLNEIGVFAHELGHGFGLPDLYAVGDFDHAGVGRWGLMGTGAWGCSGGTPEAPCHMTGWTKAVLGWVDVVELVPGMDHGVVTIPPVETSRVVYRVATDDVSGTHLLLENRQRLGFDSRLLEPGLLVWQIDQERIDSRVRINRVNSDAARMGVWLRQADGRNDLGSPFQGRGDPGDPFPGQTGNRAFHVASNPRAVNHLGEPLATTLVGVEASGTDIRLRISTRRPEVTIRIEGADATDLISVDGGPAGAAASFRSVPFEEHGLVASGGEPLDAGLRRGFTSWEDGSGPTRSFVTGWGDSVLVATYGDLEVQLTPDFSGPVQGISPGSLRTSPGLEDGWVTQGEIAVIEALAGTGFGFAGWGGVLEGSPNPVTRLVDAPMSVLADFVVTFSAEENPATVVLLAGVGAQEHQFSVVNANQPVLWSVIAGALPAGVRLSGLGALRGAPVESGDFPLSLNVVDAVGLEDQAEVTVRVPEPAFAIGMLIAPFVQSGTPLSSAAREYLDHGGNRNGVYDLGDFRAYMLGGAR